MFRRAADKALQIGTAGAAAIAGLFLLSIIAFIIKDAAPFFNDVRAIDLFIDDRWGPTSGEFNIVPMVFGTISTSLLALLIASPLGIACALFIKAYATPFLAKNLTRLIELFVGMPSVILGLWGLSVLVPILAELSPPGTGLLSAGLVLTVMILPTITLFSLSALDAVPPAIMRSAQSLGLSRWALMRQIALPIARSGIVTGLCLALARALGETMAVLMVAGNVPAIPDSLFSPVRTLTTNIALEMAYALDTHRAALFVSGLLVLALTLALVMISDPFRKAEK